MNFRAYKKSKKILLPVNSFKSICINSERLTEEEFDDLVIMRGTGIFDKTGVEIFEGDIIKCDLSTYNFAIEWNNEACRFYWYYFSDTEKEIGSLFSSIEECNGRVKIPFYKTIEIIGNIYKDPNLL
jgi:hypothetical protein